jgi:hypothetical protein
MLSQMSFSKRSDSWLFSANFGSVAINDALHPGNKFSQILAASSHPDDTHPLVALEVESQPLDKSADVRVCLLVSPIDVVRSFMF